jgi:hypothetical protein
MGQGIKKWGEKFIAQIIKIGFYNTLVGTTYQKVLHGVLGENAG